MKVAVISDHIILTNRLKALIDKKQSPAEFHFYSTAWDGVENIPGSVMIDIKNNWEELLGFDLVFSLHCKQLFPPALVKAVKCINIHPGLNPHNRGWCPHVFSIINHLPAGATIHEIDEQLDHGSIIAQQEVPVEIWDTSQSAYEKILDAEMQLLKENMDAILNGSYKSIPSSHEGNVNGRKDFAALCAIDLNEASTYGEVLNRLRALTHDGYQNAWFTDPKTGKKIFVNVSFTVDG